MLSLSHPTVSKANNVVDTIESGYNVRHGLECHVKFNIDVVICIMHVNRAMILLQGRR